MSGQSANYTESHLFITHLRRSASVNGRRLVAARRATSSLAPLANDGNEYAVSLVAAV